MIYYFALAATSCMPFYCSSAAFYYAACTPQLRYDHPELSLFSSGSFLTSTHVSLYSLFYFPIVYEFKAPLLAIIYSYVLGISLNIYSVPV